MKILYFITSNNGKFKEIKKKFQEIDIKIIQKDLGYPEIQADKLEDVASFGINYLKKNLKHPFIIEDAGLFINKLNDFPGVYSAYFYKKIGCKGILNLMNDIGTNDREAFFKSVIAFSQPNKKPVLFIGKCQGNISTQEIGKNGFGYDPIFIPNGEIRTFAQMETDDKNSYSHRGKSLEKLVDFLKNV